MFDVLCSVLAEPFAGIDPLAVADIQGIISYLKERGMGILINMFSLQYIFELYKKPLVCIVLIVVSVIVLILSRKYIKSFWTKNIWSRQFLLIFIAFNVLASSIDSVLGYKLDDILLVNVENVSNVTKLILIIFYIVIFKNTELPNSFFIRFASKNEALLNRKN